MSKAAVRKQSSRSNELEERSRYNTSRRVGRRTSTSVHLLLRPLWLIKSNSLHEGLRTLALSLGVEMVLQNPVTFLDAETGSITLENGAKVTGDVVIGADGIHVCHSLAEIISIAYTDIVVV